MIGWMEGLVILGVVIMFFGARRLPQLGGAVGESIKNFKKALQGDNVRDVEELESAKKEDEKKKT
jgi:sec-independent protein translocase protein TatA